MEHNKREITLPPLVTRQLNYLKLSPEDQENSDQSDNISGISTKKLCSGKLKIEEICIACRKSKSSRLWQHPFFNGGLCDPCQKAIKETAFAMGSDGKNICCIICAEPGSLVLCENVNCPKSFCIKCMKFYLGNVTFKQILEASPWECFFCSTSGINTGLLRVKKDWEKNIFSFFKRHSLDWRNVVTLSVFSCKKPITVLSLFDGIGTGKHVLDELGLKVSKYYASEFDKDAINISKFHHKESIIYIDNPYDITDDQIKSFGNIDLVICGLFANKVSAFSPGRKDLVV